MALHRPQVTISIGRAPASGLLRMDLVSSLDSLRAALTFAARAPQYDRDDVVEVRVGGQMLLRADIYAVEPVARRMRRYLAEPLSSQMLRGLAPGWNGPFAWRHESSRTMAAAVLAGLPHELAALPDADLRWSAPRAPRRWLLDSLLRAVAGVAGFELGYLLDSSGTVMLGPIDALRRPSGISLRTGETILRRRGAHYAALAAPVLAGTTVTVDGAALACHYARLDVRAGRYRSYLVLDA